MIRNVTAYDPVIQITDFFPINGLAPVYRLIHWSVPTSLQQKVVQFIMGFVSFENNQVYYETTGKGEPLLMVMGLGGNSQVWAPIRRHLAGKYSLVMYDMQG